MHIRSLLAFGLIASFGLPAQAGQSKPPASFNGTYGLSCESVTFTLAISLSGSIGGAAGHWYDHVDVPMHCDGISDEERDALAEEISLGCQGAGFPEPDCDDFGMEFAVAAADYNNDVVDFFPHTVKMTVNQTSNWWYKLWGVYPMTGNHYVWDETTQTDVVYTWNYLINNNDGSVNGDFAAASMALGSSTSDGNFACTTFAAAAIDGKIYANTGYTMDLDWLVDETLVCGASEGSDWLLGTASIALSGGMSGTRM